MKNIKYIISLGIVLSVISLSLIFQGFRVNGKNNTASGFWPFNDSSEKDIISYSVRSPIFTEGEIKQDKDIILVNIPWNIDVADMKVVIKTSAGATTTLITNEGDLISSEINIYTVRAEDGSTKDYKVVFLGGSSVVSPNKISTCEDLQNIALNINSSADYFLANNIDCSGVEFKPIGGNGTPFRGNLLGNGFTISNINIPLKNSGDYRYAGLFGVLAGNVRDIKLENGNAYIPWAQGNYTVALGGIAGMQLSGSNIINSSYSGNLDSRNDTGGLVGISYGNIIESYSSGKFSAGYYSSRKYGTHVNVGGLVGVQGNTGKITDSYSNALVSTDAGYPSCIEQAGGLVANASGKITDSYFSGTVFGEGTSCRSHNYKGGLVSLGYLGTSTVTIENSYWDITKSGGESAGGIGKNTDEMKKISTYNGWSSSIWNMAEGFYPVFK